MLLLGMPHYSTAAKSLLKITFKPQITCNHNSTKKLPLTITLLVKWFGLMLGTFWVATENYPLTGRALFQFQKFMKMGLLKLFTKTKKLSRSM
jgi:hypothetical protein